MTVKVKEFFKIPDDLHVDSFLFRLGTGSPCWSPSYCSSGWFDKASKKPLCPSARLLSLNQFEWLWACCTAEHNRPCFAGTMLGFVLRRTSDHWSVTNVGAICHSKALLAPSRPNMVGVPNLGSVFDLRVWADQCWEYLPYQYNSKSLQPPPSW